MTDLFTAADIVSTYTDQQAIRDGVLANLTALFGGRLMFRGRPVNRITRSLLEEMLPFLIDVNDPMRRQASTEYISVGHAENLRQTIQTKLRYARDTADYDEQRGTLYELPPYLYLALNEAGGWTLMLKSDY